MDAGHVTHDDYLIWSNEHSAWWGPDSDGYTSDLSKAGIYSRDFAMEIVENATLDWRKAPNEVPVAVMDIPDDAQTALGLR